MIALAALALGLAAAPTAIVHHPVSTKIAAAQQRFDEGLTLVYSFNRSEARERFEDAAKLDPKLAMAWWGVALAVGPNINEAMSAADRDAAAGALAKATALAGGASAEERRYIDALAHRYPSPAQAAADTAHGYPAYRDAMKALTSDFPNDLDAATLYAESIMDVDTVRFVHGAPAAAQTAVVRILDSVLERDPHHLGANHYLIHAWDHAGDAHHALASATYLADLNYEPAQSHLQHMPAHTFLDVGDLANVTRVGRLSSLDDDGYAKAKGIDPFSLRYHRHNLDFWAGGAFLTGERGEIDQSLAEYTAGHDSGAALILARESRFTEADAVPRPVHGTYALLEWHYARTLSAVGRDDLIAAQREVTAIDVITVAQGTKHPTDDSLDAIAHARLAHALGRDAEAIDLLRACIAKTADDPPEAFAPWSFPAGEWLGDILLERGDLAGAEEAFRADLARTPNNPRVQYRLMRTLTYEGRLDDARVLAPQVAAHWLGDSTDLHEPDL